MYLLFLLDPHLSCLSRSVNPLYEIIVKSLPEYLSTTLINFEKHVFIVSA